jgi:uncharacterized membrane protein YphA (DoxX/SURF4 family)
LVLVLVSFGFTAKENSWQVQKAGSEMEVLLNFWESIGGLMLATGFLFRPAAAMLGFTMFIAVLSHLISGQGNPGHAFKNLFALYGLVCIGPGKYSLDHLIKSKSNKIME